MNESHVIAAETRKNKLELSVCDLKDNISKKLLSTETTADFEYP